MLFASSECLLKFKELLAMRQKRFKPNSSPNGKHYHNVFALHALISIHHAPQMTYFQQKRTIIHRHNNPLNQKQGDGAPVENGTGIVWSEFHMPTSYRQ